MDLPDDADYYDEPGQCTNNWRTCPCTQCETKREEHDGVRHQRKRDREFDDE